MANRPLTRSLVLLLGLLILSTSSLFARTPEPAVQIQLQGFRFDPLVAEPALNPSERSPQLMADQPDLYLVQFVGPIREDWKAAVQASGAALYDYIPDYALIAQMDAATAEQVRHLEVVRWVGAYHPAYRLDPALRDPMLAEQALQMVTIQTLPDADHAAVQANLKALGITLETQSVNALAASWRAQLTPAQIQAVASLPEVLWIERFFAPERLDERAAVGIMRTDVPRAQPGLYGAGQIVGVADSGFDTGDLNRLHPDFAGRLIKAYCLGRPQPCDWSDADGHGTHVAGSVLGSGVVSGSNPANRQYNNSFAGTAPEARLVFQSTADAMGALTGIPQDNGQLMRQAYADGARIHTNSWGGPTGGQENPWGGYVSSSRNVDLAAWELKDMLIIFAAGNSGQDANQDGVIDPDSMAQPATAKNVLTVGASENNRAELTQVWGQGYGAPIATDRRADNPNGMAAFSSRGPTDDGRIKPDVVAPGTFIVSARTRGFLWNDNLEGETSGYRTDIGSDGGTNAWRLAGPAHSGQRAWLQTANGQFQAGAFSALFLPPINVMPAASAFDLSFFHRYNLSGDDKLVLILWGPRADNPQQMGQPFFYELTRTGASNGYQFFDMAIPVGFLIEQRGLDPRALLIGFAIIGTDGTYANEWALDDLRVDGAEWADLYQAGLTEPRTNLDEHYHLMGGTSMATPLTAGVAALTREWLQKARNIANPSGALMKAVLMNGAVGMGSGQYGEGAIREIPALTPNAVNGWGRVDAAAALVPQAPRQIWLSDQTTGLRTGETRTFELQLGRAESAGAVAPVLAATPQAAPPAAEATPVAAAPLRLDPTGLGSEPTTPREPRQLGERPPTTVDLDAQLTRLAPASPVSPAQTGNQLLLNPGFENATLTPWKPVSSPRLTNQVQRSGAQAVLLAGRDNANDAIAQLISVPADSSAAILTGYVAAASEEIATGYDSFCAGIWTADASQAIGGFCADALEVTPNQWNSFSFTLTPAQLAAVAGRQVLIGITSKTDEELPSVFAFDDLAFTVAGGSTTPVPTTPVPTTPVPTTPVPTTPVPTTPVPPPPDGGAFRLTLSWTDYPGNPAAARALVNDLDLEIVGPDGTLYRGNAGLYPTGNPCRGETGQDRCNNVETVLIPKAAPGVYRVTVRAVQVAQGGQQPFALAGWGNQLRAANEQPPPELKHKVFLPLTLR